VIVNEPEIAASAQKIVPKLWGTEFWMIQTEKYSLKYLKINPGFQCSIHCHAKKDETFLGMTGTARLNIHTDNGAVHTVHAIHQGQQYRVRPKVYHSFQAVNVAWVCEVSTSHDDRDVIRLQESRRVDG
jgi:mannose-6-phosphate isomerase-like protein (cupin superfamily)